MAEKDLSSADTDHWCQSWGAQSALCLATPSLGVCPPVPLLLRRLWLSLISSVKRHLKIMITRPHRMHHTDAVYCYRCPKWRGLCAGYTHVLYTNGLATTEAGIHRVTMTSPSLWSRYDRQFVGITRRNASC